MAQAKQYFIHLQEYGLIICRECKYAVWPAEVEGHLGGLHHRVKKENRQDIAQEVNKWRGIIQTETQLGIPSEVVNPICELPVYNGLLCTVQPDICKRIYREEASLKKHWREKHTWKVTESGQMGRLNRSQKERAEDRFNKAQKKVQCQRFFPSRYGSQYFEVATPEVEEADINSWQEIQRKANQAFEEKQRAAATTIQEGEPDEINPWLERTGWHKYLKEFDPEKLMASVEKPGSELENPEPYEEVIWNTMTQVAQTSQFTVSQSGVFVRMEAIRTEQHQNRYVPLETYWDKESIERRAQPWRQVLMFFVRTQKAHDWRSPPYKFTRAQFAAFSKLIDEAEKVINQEEAESQAEEEEPVEEAEMNGVQRACLDFCIQLLNQEITQNEYESALVCALAVLGVCETGWREPDSYPPVLSAMIKCARFMVVQKAVNMAKPSEEHEFFNSGELMDLENNNDSGYESNGSNGGDGSPTSQPSSPASQCSHILTDSAFVGSSGLASSRMAENTVTPDRNQAAAHRGFEWSLPQPQRQRVEEPRAQRRAASTKTTQVQGCLRWVDKMMNAFMVRGTKGPMQWMLDLRTYGLKIHYNTTTRGHVEWCNGDELLYKSAQFTMPQFRSMVHGVVTETSRILAEELLFCADSKELPEFSWNKLRDNPSDTRPGWNFLHDQRTQLPFDGKDWLFNKIGSNPDIQRQFERKGTESGMNRERVEKYMASIARFKEKVFACMHFSSQPGRVTEVLSVRHSNTRKGSHRNIFIEDGMMVYVTRYHKGYALSGDVKVIHRYLPREIGELVVRYLWLVLPFEQRLRSFMYGQEDLSAHLWSKEADGRKWTSNRAKRVLQAVTEAGLGHALGVHDYREVVIGISRRFMGSDTAFRKEEDMEDEEEDGILDRQAGHGTHVAGIAYARGIMEMAGVIASERQRFRRISIDWHRFLGFESATEPDGSIKRKRCPFEEEADAARIERWQRLRRMNAGEQFRRMMKKESTFRGVQKQSIEAIQAGVSPIVAVMATGTGKSMLFMLPAWAEPGGTTIVVVPLIALRTDMIRRCNELGISCAEWNVKAQPDAETIVFVTPESVVGDEFRTFINRLKSTRQLDRIVIDECHIILNNQADFRPKLQRLGELAGAETQMVLLTATLPPSEEVRLWERMNWLPDEVMKFRTSTVRKNIMYSVTKPGRRTRPDEHDAFVAQFVNSLTGKVVVYCNTAARVKRIVESGLVECAGFYGKMKKAVKADVLEGFRVGKIQVIIATSALGMGIDISDIRTIVHADEPRTMLDYAQESGRAGRDGQASQAIIVQGSEKSEDALVQEYVDGENRCRRVVLDRYLDGDSDRVECKEGEELCDGCKARSEQVETAEDVEVMDTQGDSSQQGSVWGVDMVDRGSEAETEEMIRQEWEEQQRQRAVIRRRAINKRREGQQLVEDVQRQLELWKGRCVVCAGLHIQDGHIITDCTHGRGREAGGEVKRRRNRIRFERYSACFKCGVPQSMCKRYEEDGKGGYQIREGTGWCQFYGVMASTVFGFRFGFERIWERWRERLMTVGVNIEKEGAIERYLGVRKDQGLVQGSNLVWEFGWIAGEIESELN